MVKTKNKTLDPEKLEAYQYASLADSPNTQRAYISDLKHFNAWCKKRKKRSLPVEPDDLALYLRYCARTLKISTIQRRLSAISEAHKRASIPSPTSDWIVRNTMKRLKRERGAPPRGKSPILVKDLKRMVELCDESDIEGIRDKAILLIGFCGALRRSDLVNLDVEDILKADEGIVLLIRRGKTDQERKGRKIAIPFGKDPLTCPIQAVIAWLKASELESGPLFRGLTKNRRPRTTRMASATVAEIVKKYCTLIGKRRSNFSGHSLRAGFATSAAMAGASERSIQKQTGHKSLIVLRRYIREAHMFRDNALNVLDL